MTVETNNSLKSEYILRIHDIFTNSLSFERIIELQLSGCDLKYLPDVICSCINVLIVDLSCNKFDRVPPSLITGLPKIERLDLSHNLLKEFNYPIKSTGLKWLGLSHNVLHNLPKWLWNACLPDFSYLDLSGNKRLFTMTDLNDIMDKSILLKRLNVIDPHFNETIFKILSTMPKLQELSLGVVSDYTNSNDLMTFPSNENYCSDLVIAKLCNVNLFDIIPEVCNMAHLIEIDLRYNNLMWLPQNFGCLISLKVCFLSNNKIIMLPDSFDNLGNLEIFHISNNQLSSLPKNFNKMLNLMEVDLYNNEIDKLPDGIERLHGLDFALNYIDEYESVLYIKQKEFLRNKYNFNLRNNGRKEELPEQSEEEPLFETSESSSGGSCHNKVVNQEIEILDFDEEWVPEYNDDYWEPSQDYHLVGETNLEWNCTWSCTSEHQTNSNMQYEEGQFSDDSEYS